MHYLINVQLSACNIKVARYFFRVQIIRRALHRLLCPGSRTPIGTALPSEGRRVLCRLVPREIKRHGHNAYVQNATRVYVVFPTSGCTTQDCPLRTVWHYARKSGTQNYVL
jgi:hypothetical protein